MIILIGGYSASGKSYLAKNIANHFGYKCIYPSYILKEFYKNNEKPNIYKTKMNTGWYDKSNMDKLRQQDPSLDKKLDKYLLEIIEKEDNLVIDSWTLPYLTNKGIRIWLKTSLEERGKRLALRDNVSFNEAIKIIKRKDNTSINLFKKLYGFEYGKDLSVFNYIINTDDLTIEEVYKKTVKILKTKIK